VQKCSEESEEELMDGHREKYEIVIASPMGINLLVQDEINAYVVPRIKGRLRDCMLDFVAKHEVAPQVIRVSGKVFTLVKKATEKELDRLYISDKDVTLDAIPIKAGCDYLSTKVVLEFWDGVEESKLDGDNDD
jgi:hypothetical protein